MASDNEASCASDPNFAVICSFLECFGKSCGIVYPDIARLQEMLENTQEVPQQLIDLHIKLLRKTRKTVSPEKWERALVKFCHTYSNQDGWELERFGYKKARIAVKLRLLKVLLETQFDLNQKFKNEVNKLAANELRVEPMGRDKSGLAYWFQLDEECNIRVYREDLDEENWELVAKDREGVVTLINTLSNGEAGDIPINEDSNSIEISEKPIIDTGQVTTSPSLEDEAVQENGAQAEGLDEKELDKSEAEDFEDEQEQEDDNDADNDDEDDMDPEEDVTNDESSKQNTEEDDSQEMMEDEAIESNVETQLPAPVTVAKVLNGKVDALSEQEVLPSQEKEVVKPQETPVPLTSSEIKIVEPARKADEPARTSNTKTDTEEPVPLKSIETPVITSPLKLVNIADLKQPVEEKSIPPVAPIGTSISITKKHNIHDDSTESVMRSLEKLSGKNNLTFTPTEMPTMHSKLSVKPIDQLAANLVRIQSEKLEKPSGAKSLEKIAENLARSGSMLGNMMNGEDDRLPQDYCARSQADKAGALRGHRGMDLSTSPRGWETTNEQSRPMDFSGIDLSSRKFNKTLDSPVTGYRQDFQQREMDLSTKKLNKPEITSMPYDTRTVMMRNHAMVADLSKRQMPFTAYDMPSAVYHNTARIPAKEDHRLPNYTILPDPSKITALRMSAAPVKRPLEGDDAQQDMLKRIRADVIPIRGSMDKRPMISTNWRDEVGEAIEEPVMMVQGEGSGSDCDAVNPGLGEAVEEPTIFFYGEGSGQDCETGNPGDDASTDNKQSNEAKNEADSATAPLSPSKSLNEDKLVNDAPAESVVTNKTPVKLNRNYPQSSMNAKENCQIVGSTQEKPKFKPTLGIQIIPKSVSGSVKRISRWDVGKPDERTECDSSIISNEGDISPKRNAYDYECHAVEQNVLSTDKDSSCEEFASGSQDVKIDGNSVNPAAMEPEERNVEVKEAEETTSESENAVNAGQSPTVQGSMQCDSSISLCQADTSEAFESCTEAVPRNRSSNEKNTVEDTYDNDSGSSLHKADGSKETDSECKPLAASPPRFFFGPNCISYTSKTDESQSDAIVTTSVHSKPDTLQYECVSSSKPVEDPMMPYKSDDFDITQTNNNSLKINSFTAGSNNALCEKDSKMDAEKLDGPSNLWDQTISSKYKVEQQSYVVPKTEADISNSESKVEAKESTSISNAQDPISSSENTASSYAEKMQFSDSVSQPHSTHDLSTTESKQQLSNTERQDAVAEQSASRSSVSESTEYEAKSGESSETDKLDMQDNIDKATVEAPSGSLKDEDCDTEDVVKSDSMMPTNSCSLPSTQNNEHPSKNSFSELSCISTSEFPGYQEVDSSATQDMDQISDKYSSFKKSESNSPGGSYDKQSDKNDNFSEFDGQEEQSLDTDNERMKNLAGSDADSMCVNYDKNSERFDALSDAGAQDEGFGDSGELKEKNSAECVIRESVPDVNVEGDFPENSAVTSSESIGQCNKDASVPTISSSDDACTQDTSSQESSDVQVDSEKLEEASSVKADERLGYNILPAIVPDTNIFKPSNPENVELRKEIGLSNIVQTTNEYADDVSENRSSCIDQDSNEDMVIDDRLSESNDSPKDPDGTVGNEEKFRSIESFQPDKNIVDTNRSSSEPYISSVKESPAAESFGIVPKVNEKEAASSLDVLEKLSDVSKDCIADNQMEEESVQRSESTTEPTKEDETDKNNEQCCPNNNVDVTDNFQKGPSTPETIEPKLNQADAIATESVTSVVEDKQSLVANYDSGDSNDGSDDVFESDSTEPNESKIESSSNIGTSEIDKEHAPEMNADEELTAKERIHVPNNSQSIVAAESEAEVKSEQKTDEFALKEEAKVKEEGSDKVAILAEVDQKQYNYTGAQNNLNVKSHAPTADSKFKEETKPCDAFCVDSGKLSDAVELNAGAAVAPENRDIFSNQISKECTNSSLVTMNCLIPTVKAEEESKTMVEVAEKMANFAEERKTDPMPEIEKFGQIKVNAELGDMNNQMNMLKEPHVNPVEEKVITNLDNDASFMKGKNVESHLTQELAINQPYGRLKEFSEFGNKENKFDVKLQSEYYLSKSAEGLDMSVQSASNILPLKPDNVSSCAVNKPEIFENDNAPVRSGELKLANNLNFTNFAAEKSENLEPLANYDNHNEPLIIKNIAEPIHNNVFSAGNDTAVFTAQEPAAAIEKIDPKKEGNKRLCDISDLQDVPPVKSKPRYAEPNEEMPKDVPNTQVQLDSFKQSDVPVEVATTEAKPLNTETVSVVAESVIDTTNLESQIEEKEEKMEVQEVKESSEIQSVDVKPSSLASDDSLGADNESLFATNVDEADPLAGTEDDETIKKLTENTQEGGSAPKIGIRVKSVSELVYEGWKLDSTEPPKVSRKRRNSSHESNSEDGAVKQEDDEMMGGKRIKLRGKRMPDRQLRKSIEESREAEMSSEDEAEKPRPEITENQEGKDASDDQGAANAAAMERKIRGRPRGRRRRGKKRSGSKRQKHSELQATQLSEVSPGVHMDGTPSNDSSLSLTPSAQKKRKKRKMVLGLEIGRDIAPEVEAGVALDETPVRQSRRIAQLKIKEEADRRRIEEEALCEMKEKKEFAEKKKRRKPKAESEEDPVVKEVEKEKKSKKKRKKRKKKKMLAKFNEANPWQSSSGSSTDDDDENEDEDDEEEEIESEGSLLFKSDHEFSPESDLEKDQQSEPLRRARTAQKAQSDVEEADDEYACQKCGKADHPEWILLCDSCDKGWHCSCLRPALMLIPEGDWFCPPCQHNLLVVKLRESLKTYDQLIKRHENEVLRKKRLAFVGISLDNVLHKNEAPLSQKGSKASSQESDNETTSSSSESSTETSSSDESEPVYQLRERRCANTYKFNEYDDMINAAIQDEVEAVQGAGNQGRGKDIATIVNAEKEEAQLHFQAEALKMEEGLQDNKDATERKSEKDSDEEYKVEGDDLDEEEEEQKRVTKKLLSRKKHRKLNSLDISSEDDPESDEDFKGSSSEEEEDFDDHITSSDESTFMDVKRRGKRGEPRPVRRSTRARMTTRYDEDFINDESEESDRPKRKKSRSMWGDSDSEDSDNSWRQRKKKSRTIPTSRCRTLKVKNKKKKKRKRIIESDNQSDNEEEEDARAELSCEPSSEQVSQPQEGAEGQVEQKNPVLPADLEPKLEGDVNNENNGNEINNDTKDVKLEPMNADVPTVPVVSQQEEPKKKKEVSSKPKKSTGIRRKIIYGGLPDENRRDEEEVLGRRTRGRKINYQEELGSDSEEELKKALRKTGESEDEFIVNEGEEANEDNDKDSDSGDIYHPKKDGPKFKNKSPKSRRPRKSKSPGAKRKAVSDGAPKQRKKPGPKPGSKNRSRKQKFSGMGSVIKAKDDPDGDMMAHMMDNPIGDVDSKIDDNLGENVGLTGTTISVASSFTGDVPEGSLTGLGAGELAELDDEQLEQMMMEDEEYGRRQLELAAIEIAKKKKKEEREAKKLEKARLKALEILAAERQRDPNAPEGTDGEAPKKKKRGRRSKAEILAEQMRRDGAPNLAGAGLTGAGLTSPGLTSPGLTGAGLTGAGLTGALPSTLASSVSPTVVNPVLTSVMTPEAERTGEGHIPMITGPDGQMFNPDGTPVKPKRRGRGKGKKTLALEAARAAEAAAKAAAEAGLIGMGTDSNPEMKPGDIPNVLPTPGSSTSGSAPSTPPAGAVSVQGPPSTQPSNSQAVYPSLPPNQQQSSVITRMLQSQPVSSSPQSFTAAAAAMGHKYFGGPNTGGQIMGGPRTGYEMQPRGRIPSPYRQAGQSTMPPHFAAVRSGTPPMRMRVPGPQMYHTPHHPMDPSPSGGGPISINNRDRSSPLGPGPAMIPPAAGSPLAKGGPTPPPPPPPYVRGGPPLSRFADNPMGPRHQMPPFTNASPANHNLQQPSPPPNRPPGNFSPYHPPPPPNYHYGAYPPPPPMSTADDAAAYQGSPYPAEHFSSPADNPPPIQAPPPPQGPPQQQPPHPNEAGVPQKQYDEEGTGEFGGLVSYFSSQREDDLDS